MEVQSFKKLENGNIEIRYGIENYPKSKELLTYKVEDDDGMLTLYTMYQMSIQEVANMTSEPNRWEESKNQKVPHWSKTKKGFLLALNRIKESYDTALNHLKDKDAKLSADFKERIEKLDQTINFLKKKEFVSYQEFSQIGVFIEDYMTSIIENSRYDITAPDGKVLKDRTVLREVPFSMHFFSLYPVHPPSLIPLHTIVEGDLSGLVGRRFNAQRTPVGDIPETFDHSSIAR